MVFELVLGQKLVLLRKNLVGCSFDHGEQNQNSEKNSQGDVRIFHFQMWKFFVKTHQKYSCGSRNQIHRILSKFVHPSSMRQLRTYFVVEENFTVKFLKNAPNQKNGCFRCFFHISSNKKSLTVKILFILKYVVIPVVINTIFVF